MSREHKFFSNFLLPNIAESTYSGLLLGLHGNNYQIPVTGISVLNPKDVLKNMISELTEQTADYMGIDIQVSREDIVCFDEYIGLAVIRGLPPK